MEGLLSTGPTPSSFLGSYGVIEGVNPELAFYLSKNVCTCQHWAVKILKIFLELKGSKLYFCASSYRLG